MHGQVSQGSPLWMKNHRMDEHEHRGLTNAGELRGIWFIDPEGEEFRISWKMSVERWNFRCQQQCHVNFNMVLLCSWRTQAKICLYCWSRRIFACTHGRISSQESWRSCCRKRSEFTESLQFGAQIYSYASSNDAQAAVEKEWENWRKFWHGSKEWGRKSSFCLTDGHLSFEECRIGGKAPKIQRSSCIPRWYCKGRYGVLCSIHWARIISISNDGGKSHWYHLQTAWLRRTSSRK